MKSEKRSWMKSLFAYAEGEKKRMLLSVLLSVGSVVLGLVPFYCMYRLICLFADTANAGQVVQWCLLALAAYGVKILLFSLSTGVSHTMAYTILEGLRLRLADRFLHAPLGDVESHSIGEIKTMMVDKIENLEPPLAHMIPEGAGHISAHHQYPRAAVHRLAAGAGIAGDISPVLPLHGAHLPNQRRQLFEIRPVRQPHEQRHCRVHRGH